MRNLLVFAVLALALGGFAARYADQLGASAPAPRAMTAEPQPAPGWSRSVVIPRDRSGHFQVDARVDGRRMAFLVDTGASVIALRAREAARLGIHPAQRDYSVEVSTANGKVRAARVDLDRVEIGDVVVRDVAAVVLPDEALAHNLLGMSFLSKVRFGHKDGKLLIEQ